MYLFRQVGKIIRVWNTFAPFFVTTFFSIPPIHYVMAQLPFIDLFTVLESVPVCSKVSTL